MMGVRRAAIFGGTFDPVHNGHMEAARRVQHLFALDEVIFVPACVPPHKRNSSITSAFHRFAMLALATEADARLRLSTVELDAPEQPYAVDTVARFRAELGHETQLFFLMGADSWLEITSWHDWRRLLGLCHFIIVTRPGYELDPRASANKPIPVVKVRELSCRQVTILESDEDSPHAFITDAAMVDVSATAIRTAARAADYAKLAEMVPPAVANYIEKHELYRN